MEHSECAQTPPREKAKRTVAVFDLDGTLTTRDTLLEFIRFACGSRRLYLGLIRYAPLLMLMRLHLYPNGKTKELVFSHFFKGWQHERFASMGRAFADHIERFKRDAVVDKLSSHVAYGDTVYVVSASIDEWVRPWCTRLGVRAVLATQIEVVDGIITGRFATPNCYGQEKVRRLMQVEPDRSDYTLYAYGDSRGDREMIALSDHGQYITH